MEHGINKRLKKRILDRLIHGKFKEEYSMFEVDDTFPITKDFNNSNYKEDYTAALKFASKKKGLRQVYTMVDGVYLKGLHYVNRIGFCVLGYE